MHRIPGIEGYNIQKVPKYADEISTVLCSARKEYLYFLFGTALRAATIYKIHKN